MKKIYLSMVLLSVAFVMTGCLGFDEPGNELNQNQKLYRYPPMITVTVNPEAGNLGDIRINETFEAVVSVVGKNLDEGLTVSEPSCEALSYSVTAISKDDAVNGYDLRVKVTPKDRNVKSATIKFVTNYQEVDKTTKTVDASCNLTWSPIE